MLKLALCLAAASALLCFSVGTAPAAMIDFRPALIPIGQPPVPVDLAIDPAAPTIADTISFTAPLDGEDHSNKWYAAKALLGRPVLAIDEANHTIHIHFDGVFSDICPEIYAPVIGAYGELGPLVAGNWTLYNSHGESLAFTVTPEPGSLLLLGVGAAGLLARGRRKR